ncbi:MAG: molecular chaperone HtpG, partial [Lentimicrobiaceae bacterium]
EGIVPDFLTLMHGLLDSPDIPLNVSRSYLQSDSNVKKISNHIMKKVADKLEELFKNNREDFESKWDDIRIFIEYGIISEPKFWERAEKFTLLKDTDGKFYTFEEYKNLVNDIQTDKDKKLVYLYTSDTTEQYGYIQAAKEMGYNVLVMDGVLDNHFVNALEQKFENTSFVRVDSDVPDKLIHKEEPMPSKLSEEEQKSMKPLFEGVAGKEHYQVIFESMSETSMPIQITRPEFMRRMKDMSMLGGGAAYMNNMPDSLNIVVNTNHPLIDKINQEKDEESRKNMAKQLIDIAKLSQNLLKGEDLADFIKRSLDILK